jgi:hypothetical protein
VRGSQPSYVCALTIISSAKELSGKVAVTVRRATTNTSFPNSLSVPTQRIPANLAHSATGTAIADFSEPHDAFFDLNWVDSDAQSGNDPVIFVVESILSRKLELAAALEEKRFSYWASVGMLASAMVADPMGHDESGAEYIAMMNVIVMVTEGTELMPNSSAAYELIAWRPATDLQRSVELNDALIVVPGGDPFQLCVKGLCLRTTCQLISGEVGKIDVASIRRVGNSSL